MQAEHQSCSAQIAEQRVQTLDEIEAPHAPRGAVGGLVDRHGRAQQEQQQCQQPQCTAAELRQHAEIGAEEQQRGSGGQREECDVQRLQEPGGAVLFGVAGR